MIEIIKIGKRKKNAKSVKPSRKASNIQRKKDNI